MIFAQPLGNILGVRHRLNSLGVDGLHGFDQGENAIEMAESGLRLGVTDLKAREMGNAPDLFKGKRHGVV